MADKIHVIACGVLAIDIKRIAKNLGIEITTEFLEGGLHENPRQLRRNLQESIDRASSEGNYSKIAVGYGLCGQGTSGIRAGNIPLAIPKVHDCISLFLGSDEAYRKEFSQYPGTYYVSAGWIEEKVYPKSRRNQHEQFTEITDYSDLAHKYGDENAHAIIEFMNRWKKNYQRAAFINTGAGEISKLRSYAKAMAEEFGWKYEEITGNLSLLEKMILSDATNDEILIVPPGHTTFYNSMTGTLEAVPSWKDVKVEDISEELPSKIESTKNYKQQTRIGLGIDAGGTYTDVVLFDFLYDSVISKAKSLTTKWDYTVGINNALSKLDNKHLKDVDLVSVSTTLATNAIVEGKGQSVGLLIMPPYGNFDPEEISHEPKAVISGQLEITGEEKISVNPEEVRKIAREMVNKYRIGAFAVSGFAGTVNPGHELEVKRIIREETGLSVTCGHELSERLNFKTRADTAVLNARIMPLLEKFLRDIKKSLQDRNIHVPVMVVKGDGSLMTEEVALERPIETILSGPAASVAGAKFLTNCTNAIIVDMGGTTSDIAEVKNSIVKICQEGAHVGKWLTHVKALDMRSTGLGGDSLISFKEGELDIGPLRVSPISWLSINKPHTYKTLDYIKNHIDKFLVDTQPMEILFSTGRKDHFELDLKEEKILAILNERPHSLSELAEKTGSDYWKFLNYSRLENNFIVQRCSLTPTDLLHVNGSFQEWDTKAAKRLSEIFAEIVRMDIKEFNNKIINSVVNELAVELIKKQLENETDPYDMEKCEVCQLVLKNILNKSSTDYEINFKLNKPVIGLGAPVKYFIPQSANLLGTEAVIPEHADVANAIGAITSWVSINKQVKIGLGAMGKYEIYGLSDSKKFGNFDEAFRYAVTEVKNHVRSSALSAGTTENNVDIQINDRMSKTSDGTELFIERVINANLTGPPDYFKTKSSG